MKVDFVSEAADHRKICTRLADQAHDQELRRGSTMRNGRTICPLLSEGLSIQRRIEAMWIAMMMTALAVILAGTAPSPAQPNLQGAVKLSDGTKVPQNPSIPKLNLTNAQREQIRKGVLAEDNEVEFRLKTTKSAKDFSPVAGAKIPKGVRAQSLPTPVLSQMPELRDYMYVKMKDQVLIVNGMTNEIVDVFSETQPLS